MVEPANTASRTEHPPDPTKEYSAFRVPRSAFMYHVAVFLSAFLLFQVQPMTAKLLLPSFGGSYLVWGGCMVFYQAVLLLGYLYAHVVQKRIGVARYAVLHLVLVIAAFFFCPLAVENFAAIRSPGALVVKVFVVLGLRVGVPAFVLSTTSVLLQRWLSVSDCPEHDNPYVLYSASNLGSMLGLLTYPLLVEPLLTLEAQSLAWWGGFALLFVCQVVCVLGLRCRCQVSGVRFQGEAKETEEERRSEFRVPSSEFLTWFLLSAGACAMLLAVTNVLTFDIASVPFLWVAPLSVYLLSFVLTFKRRAWFPGWVRTGFFWALLGGITLHVMGQVRLTADVRVTIPLQLGLLFVVTLNTSGWLAKTRPADPRQLTMFYLVIAAGGLAGSLLVSWAVPLVSASLVELPAALALAAAGVALAARSARPTSRQWAGVLAWCVPALLAVTLLPWLLAGIDAWAAKQKAVVMFVAMAGITGVIMLRLRPRPWGLVVLLVLLVFGMEWTEILATGAQIVHRRRNYYGIYKVYQEGDVRYLRHGSTQHGRQYVQGPKTGIPLAYYHPAAPAGNLLYQRGAESGAIGMIGLGTGALVAYAGPGQEFTIYELDPDNVGIATKYFSYLDHAFRNGARLTTVIGDGRLSVRAAGPASHDILIVDAFNSGSIPVHLLTVEAFRDYARALRPGGLLLLHVSNNMLDLEPVVYSTAAAAGLAACEKSYDAADNPDAESTYWMALSQDPDAVRALMDRHGWHQGSMSGDLPRPWTDRYSNVLGAVF